MLKIDIKCFHTRPGSAVKLVDPIIHTKFGLNLMKNSLVKNLIKPSKF